MGSLSTTESRYSEARIRGALDARSLPGVDRGTEEGLDPALPRRASREGREVRVPDPPRAARPVERVLRPQGGDAVSGAPEARGARVRAEPVAGAGERHAEEVLPTHGPRADRAERGTVDLGRDDPRRGAGAGGSPMTPSEDYVGRVRRAMAGMEPAVRDDILRELRSHIAESTAANGGNVGSSLTALGTPEEVGRRYRELYGYGRGFKGLFAVIAFLLAFASVPVLSVGSESLFPYALSLVFLIIAAAWILWLSVAAGSRPGLLPGLGAMASRFVGFGIAAGTLSCAPTSAHRARLARHFAAPRVRGPWAGLDESAGKGRHAAERLVLATDRHKLAAAEDEPIHRDGGVLLRFHLVTRETACEFRAPPRIARPLRTRRPRGARRPCPGPSSRRGRSDAPHPRCRRTRPRRRRASSIRFRRRHRCGPRRGPPRRRC